METQSSLNFMDNIFFVIKSKKKRKKKLHLKKKYIKRRYKRLQGIIKKRIKTSRSVKKYFRVRMRRYWKKRKYFSKRKVVYIRNNFRFQKIKYKYKQRRKTSRRKIRKMFVNYFIKVRKLWWINKPKNKGKFKHKGRRKWVWRMWRYKPKKRWIFWMNIVKLRRKVLSTAKFKKLLKLKKNSKKKRKKIFFNLKSFNKLVKRKKIKKRKLSKLKFFLKNKIRGRKIKKILKNIKKFKKVQLVYNFYTLKKKKKRLKKKRIKSRFSFLIKRLKKTRTLKLKKSKFFLNRAKSVKKHTKLASKMVKKFNRLKKIIEYRQKKIKAFYLTTKLLNEHVFKKTAYFSIDDHMFLHKYTHEHYLIKFYNNRKLETNPLKIKNSRSEKRKTYTYFFNFRNKKLKTYKNARNIHWGFFLNKTIKKRRYKNFLKYFLKNQNKYILNMFDYFTFKFKLSYIFWLNFTSFLFYFYKKKLNCKEIYQFPINLNFWGFLSRYQVKKKKVTAKLHSWVVKKNKIRKTFWMQQKRNFPKFLKKKIFWNSQIKNNIQYDFITNYFVILKNVNFISNNQEIIFKNRLLKLQGFRYKA